MNGTLHSFAKSDAGMHKDVHSGAQPNNGPRRREASVEIMFTEISTQAEFLKEAFEKCRSHINAKAIARKLVTPCRASMAPAVPTFGCQLDLLSLS